jgi:HD-like signal output (HDOD) protein
MIARIRGAAAIETTILILVLAALAGAAWIWRRRASHVRDSATGKPSGSATPRSGARAVALPTIDYTNEAIESVFAERDRLAFGGSLGNEAIHGTHATILARISAALEDTLTQREYLPRRPMQLPKLMQALNDPEVSRDALVKLILEDPAIAGGVLQQANSAFYRVSPARVDNIDRAVTLLGTDGLKRLMATAIMQPVFRLPKGHFDTFGPITWEQLERAAATAEAFATHIMPCDAFVAQLLATLEPLARVVIFRVALDTYRDVEGVQPSAAVLIRAQQAHAPAVALRIARAWKMSDLSLEALAAQVEQASPAQMRELGRAVYFARLVSALALLAARKGGAQDEESLAIIEQQGLDRLSAKQLWVAALASHEAA